MDWMKERDLLISQTMAFVQSVVVPKPASTSRIRNQLAPSDLPLAASLTTEALANELPSKALRRPEFAAAELPPAELTPKSSAPAEKIEAMERPAEIARITSPLPLPRIGMREEIQERVAAFRARQEHFIRERDAYFHAVLDKARAVTQSLPK